jgi:hypothetical protein
MDRAGKISFLTITLIFTICGVCLVYYTWNISYGDQSEPKSDVFRQISSFTTDSDEIMETTTDIPNEIEILRQHMNFHLFNNKNCGTSVQNGNYRIVNGYITELFQNPWMVALVYRYKKTNKTKISCGGSLISSEY